MRQGRSDGGNSVVADVRDPPVVIVTLRMRGHAGPSGYDRLQEYIESRSIRTSDALSPAQRVLARSLRFMTRASGSLWYHRANLIGELAAARQWFRRRGQIFHFLYGENSFRYLGNLKALGSRNAIVSTYHTPPDKFSRVVMDRRHLARLDAVVVVSAMQMDSFARIVGPERVRFVPHGIDVDYFRPGPERGEAGGRSFRCLFVGSHLRDFDTLAQAARLLRSRPEIRFTLVTKAAHHAAFSGLDNVEVLSGVDDARLLALYQEADTLVLPLLDSTANNSMLEAMACGLPIVTTDLPGVRDYVSEECALLVKKGDPQRLAEVIAWLAQDAAARQRMAVASRRHALEFRWEAIAARMREIYRSIGMTAR